MDIEEYAKKISETVERIILNNRNKTKITIDSIDVGVKDCTITYTTRSIEIVKRTETRED